MQAVSQTMRSEGRPGSIVNISSGEKSSKTTVLCIRHEYCNTRYRLSVDSNIFCKQAKDCVLPCQLARTRVLVYTTHLTHACIPRCHPLRGTPCPLGSDQLMPAISAAVAVSIMGCAVAAHGGIPKISTYAVSKAALNALTKIHAYELREARIRCVPTHPASSRGFI